MIAIEVPDEIARDKTLPAAARLLYGVIAGGATEERGCMLTVAELAQGSGQTAGSVHRNLGLLRERGLVRVEKVTSVFNIYWPVAPKDAKPVEDAA